MPKKTLKTPSTTAIRTTAQRKAKTGIKNIRKQIKATMPKMNTNTSVGNAMKKAANLTGMEMPTSRKQLKSTNMPQVKAAAKKAVKNWSSQNKGMQTAMSTIKRTRKKTGMAASTELYSKDLSKGLKHTGTYKGQSNKLGKGGRFKQLTDKLEAQGKSASSAKAIAASIGRKRYGTAKMAKWSASERKKEK